MMWRIVIASVSLLIIMISGIAYFNYGEGRATTEQYESSEHRVRFEYPSEWSVEETSESIRMSPLLPQDPLNASGIGLMSTFTIRKITEAVSLEAIQNDISGQLITSSDVLIGGKSARQIIYADDYSGEKNVLLIINANNNTYTIHYLLETTLSPVFEKIKESLVFF